MQKDNAYYPSVYNFSKYTTYLKYFYEFLKYGDFNSLKASYHYLLRNIPPTKSWQATSRLGKFHLRKGTNDFLFINYAYEKKVRDYLARESKNMTSFIDIGACIGEFCVWLAGKGVNCIAFEPVNYEAARENFRLNNVEDKVKLYSCGLGSEEKKVYFDIKKVVTSSSRIDRNRMDEPGNIEIKTLDNILPDGTFSDADNVVIKLDVEGMEVDVLEGGKNIIAGTKNISVIYEHTVSGNDDIREKLLSLGNFEFRKLDDVNTLAKKKG